MAAGDIPQCKKCSKCGTKKPLNAFAKHNSAHFGVHSTCKDCRCKASKIYRIEIQEELNEKGRNNYHKTITKQRTRAKGYYAKHAEEIQSRRLKYKEANYEKATERDRAHSKMRRQTDPAFKLNGNISTMICTALKGNKAGRHWETLVGYTLNDLKKHLEKRFKDGMNWENYGPIWHVDHILPKSVFNYTMPEHEDFKKCWALKNLQPLWAEENRLKKAKLIKHFQPSLLL